ncbi:MAG: adenylate kinase [Bacteroidales bacterium]|jgi:adenylate kinase|nr:adenylate kinase [Bacteroidales bacterium]
MVNIVLFGPPGVGKGTQSKRIISKYHLNHISTGEILRKAIEENTPLGREAQKHIDQGYYVPDEMAVKIIQHELAKYPQSRGFIFDGFPRTINQADRLEEMLRIIGAKINVMISLEANEQVIVRRLIHRYNQSARPDDKSLEIIQKRIAIYDTNTKIVKDYYKKKGKCESVCGIGEIDVIFDKICSIIERYK